MFFFCVICFWIIPRMRRDKQGRLYFHSDQHEQVKQTKLINELLIEVQFIKSRVDEIDIELLKGKAYNKLLPLEERMACGIKAIMHGVNGEFRKFMEGKLRPEAPTMYSALEKVITNERPTYAKK